jgi:hypothetical protein
MCLAANFLGVGMEISGQLTWSKSLIYELNENDYHES